MQALQQMLYAERDITEAYVKSQRRLVTFSPLVLSFNIIFGAVFFLYCTL